MTITPGRQFFNEHMEYIAAKDMAGMVTNTYTEDAILYNPFPFLDTPPPNVVYDKNTFNELCLRCKLQFIALVAPL